LRCVLAGCFFAFLSGRIVFENRRSARVLLSIPRFASFYSGASTNISLRTIVSMLWQKIALPTPLQKFLKPLKWHRERRNTRFKHEIVPSMPARQR
jgi:putative flippase GtrA